MGKTMTRWGVGPKFTAISIAYSVIIYTIHFLCFPQLTFIIISRSIDLALGIFCVILGIPIFVLPALTIHECFNQGELCTRGVYSFIRHPIYGAWIVFIIPGTTLISGSIISITIPIFMYCAFRILIVDEERYLEHQFGSEYLEYKESVGAVFPKLTRRTSE